MVTPTAMTYRPAKTNTSDTVMAQSVTGKGKAIPVTGREGPYGCETSRVPHFLDNRLTDGGEVDSLKLRTDQRAEPRNVITPRAKVKRGEVTHRGYAVSSSNPSRSP
jgi:hypothetical protein